MTLKKDWVYTCLSVGVGIIQMPNDYKKALMPHMKEDNYML